MGTVLPVRLPIISIICVLLGLNSPAFAESAAAEEQRAKLDALRTRISTLRSKMQSTSSEKSELSQRLQESEQQIGNFARKLRQLDGRLVTQKERLQRLDRQRSAQEAALREQQEALARQVRAAYAMGRQERLKILLNQQDPATVSRVLTYYDYLNRARAEEMAQIRDQVDRLAHLKREIVDEQDELSRLHDEQQRELSAMQLSQEQRRGVVEQLTRQLQDQGHQLDRLHSDEEDLKTLIKGIEEALADIPVQATQQVAFSGRRGRLAWPAKGRISSRFGAPKLGKLRWDGVMISAPEGREVRAVHHGRVAFADWLRGFGLLLIVDHGDGYMTLYGHNQSLFKEAGDWVDVNEPVALVGASGGRETSGVYFGIRYQGRAVDPAKWCKRPKGRNVG